MLEANLNILKDQNWEENKVGFEGKLDLGVFTGRVE